jgi:exopolysaccharide biosynthesis protein
MISTDLPPMPTGDADRTMVELSPNTSEPSGRPPRSSRSKRSMTRRRRIVRRVMAAFAALLLVAGAVAWWALDRFVIDHVQVGDVAAYEAEVLAEATTTTATATTDTAATASTTDATSSAPVITDTTYESGTMSISISTVVTGDGDATVTYYVADVTVADATTLRAGFAENKFGNNIVEDTSDIAAAYDAVFAINGDYYGFRDSGIVIRNGVLYRDDGARTGLAIYADGTMEVYDETTTTGQELLDAGVWNTLSFGPALLDDGVIPEGIEDVEVDTNFGNHSIQGDQPRTGIGIIGENHFVFVVVDGRSAGYSEGVTMTEFAEIFQSLGATEAYNLDGGGSSTMYFDGELVNNPLGKGQERGTSDILYLAEPAAS